MSVLALLILWCHVLLLGVSVGAGLYESRLLVPLWRALPPDRWPDPGLRFWAFVTTGPLTLTVLAGAWLAAFSAAPVRAWWLASIAVCAVERVATFAWFIPTMLRLQRLDTDDSARRAGLDRWARWALARHVLSSMAWGLALQALRAS